LDYAIASTGPVDENGIPKEPGFIGGGIGKRAGFLEHPVLNIIVDEITDAEKRIEKNGGRILQRKQPIGDGSMGFTGYFKDSEGNTVGLYQWPKPERGNPSVTYEPRSVSSGGRSRRNRE